MKYDTILETIGHTPHVKSIDCLELSIMFGLN
jgi:hypothetical protein